MKKGLPVCESCFDSEMTLKLDPVYESIENGHFQCFQLALQNVSVEEINNPPQGMTKLLFFAISVSEDERFFASLLEKKAYPNVYEEGQSILSHAVDSRTPSIYARLLLEAGTLANSANWDDVDKKHLPLMVSAGLKPDGYKYIERYYIPHVMCREVTWALVCILRKRFRIPSAGFPNGGYPLPLGLVQQIAQSVWNTRRDTEVWSIVAKKKKK